MLKVTDPTNWIPAESEQAEQPKTKLCKQCGRAMAVGRKDRVFCGVECANEHQRKVWRENNPKSPLAAMQNNTVAEVNEMKVAIDLLQRGYEVYRAAFQGMPCDMLVCGPTLEKGDLALRIEVTTGSRSTSGALHHPKRDTLNYDVLAVVLGSGEIVYKPELWRA